MLKKLKIKYSVKILQEEETKRCGVGYSSTNILALHTYIYKPHSRWMMVDVCNNIFFAPLFFFCYLDVGQNVKNVHVRGKPQK